MGLFNRLRGRGDRYDGSRHDPCVDVIGVHKIDSGEPCYLIELIVRHSGTPFDMLAFTQECPGLKAFDWQVPYEAKFLSPDGTKVVGDTIVDEGNTAFWTSPTRIAFFFHYLDLTKPLLSPFGLVALPAPSTMPDRLKIMKYEPVD